MMAISEKRTVSARAMILPDSVSDCQERPRSGRLQSSAGKCAATGPARTGSMSPSTLVALASRLAPADRELVLRIVGEGRSCAQAATMLGISERSVQRRVCRLIERLRAPQFAYAAHQIEHGGWDRPTREVARQCVLFGRTVRDAAHELGMTQHAVRARRAAILAMARGVAGLGGEGPAVWRTGKLRAKEPEKGPDRRGDV